MAHLLKGRGRRVGDDRGTAAVLGMLMGSAFFSITFVSVVQLSGEQLADAPSAEEEIALEAAAQQLVLELLGEPGAGWYAEACSGDAPSSALTPEKVRKLGLAREPCAGARDAGALNVSYQKLANLRGAQLDADPADGAVDYAEGRASLGLAGYHFHVKTRVALQQAHDLLTKGGMDPRLRPLYIGDYAEGDGPGPAPKLPPTTCSTSPATDGVDAKVRVENNGQTASAFNVKYTLPLKKATVTVYKYTPLLAAGEAADVSLFLPFTNDWSWKGAAKIDVRVKDGEGTQVGECSLHVAQSDLKQADPQGRPDRCLVFAVEWSLTEHLTYGMVKEKVVIECWRPDGVRLFDALWTLDAATGLGSVLTTEPRWHESGWKILPPVAEQTIQAKVQSALGAEQGHDAVYLPKGEQGEYTPPANKAQWAPAESTLAESAYLDHLVRNFDRAVGDAAFDHATLPFDAAGDVLPDAKQTLNERIPGLLLDAQGAGSTATYNALVIGSNVEHESLTSGPVKDPIETWVHAGGLLIVLGSNQQAVAWMQPFIHTKIQAASGSASIVDDDHPILTTPNKLLLEEYSDNDKAWDMGQDAQGQFEVVAAHGSPTLAVSRPGEFGDGRIVLTTFRPYSMDGKGATGECAASAPTGNCEGLRLLHNILTITYDDLNLDYGPDVPDDRAVASVLRVATVWHPELAAHVEVSAWVTVF